MLQDALIAVIGLLSILVLLGVWLINSHRIMRNQLARWLQKQILTNDHLNRITIELRRSTQLLSFSCGQTEGDDALDLTQEAKLYVGNIDYYISERELESMFAKYGKIAFVHIPVDRYTKKARGFGFVTFENTKDALSALDLNGAELKGRPLQVNFARDKN